MMLFGFFPSNFKGTICKNWPVLNLGCVYTPSGEASNQDGLGLAGYCMLTLVDITASQYTDVIT